MATYVNNLRLKEIATGDESGTWGTSTNTNLELIADALGSGTEPISTNVDTHSTVVADGAADEARALFLKYTGALDSACTITISPNTVNKVWFIENATSGSQNIIIKQGTGATITIGNGKVAAIYTDGAGSGAAVLDAFADLELSSTLSVAGATSFTGVTTHGDDVVSDTDSTDDLGTTGVRWANLWVDAVTATDTVTSASLVGALTGNASTATALETARTIGGTSFNGTANIAVGLATLATTVTITDNESTDENNAIVFTAGGDIDGGNLGLESDGTLTYNPSTGKVTTTAVDTQTLVVDTTSTLTGAVTASSTLAVTGTSTLTGDATVGNGAGQPSMNLNGAAGGIRDLRFQTGGSLRWAVRADEIAEAGSDAGSNFQIIARSDAGGTLGSALTITRATKAVSLSGALTVTGAATLSSTLGVTGISTLTGLVRVGTNIGGTSNSGAYSIWGGLDTLNGGFVQVYGGSHASSAKVIMGGGLVYVSSNLQATGTLTIGGASTLTGALNVTSTGPSVIGGTADGRIAITLGGGYTSDGSGNLAIGTALQHALTGAAGDTGSLAIAHVRGNINTQSATESIGVVASLKVDEPIIVDNLGGSGVVTVAASVYVTAAPTEGATNAALYVKAGHMVHAAMATSDPSVAGAFWNDSGTVKISSG